MPRFSRTSKKKLLTSDMRLQMVFNIVVIFFDCTVIQGERNKADQNLAFKDGRSQLQYPNSKHNSKKGEKSRAVDVVPYPIEWGNTNRMRFFAGFVIGIATMLCIRLRWGGDWDNDTVLKDNSFNDMAHFELLED